MKWNFADLTPAAHNDPMRGWVCMLWWVARNSQARVVVEIGLGRGTSGAALADAAGMDDGELWSIDPRQHPDAMDKVARYANWHTMPERSDAAVRNWTRPICLLLIDGDHREPQVRRDWTNWSPHVRPGGIALLHDTEGSRHAPGVVATVADIDRVAWDVVCLPGSYGMAVCRKLEP